MESYLYFLMSQVRPLVPSVEALAAQSNRELRAGCLRPGALRLPEPLPTVVPAKVPRPAQRSDGAGPHPLLRRRLPPVQRHPLLQHCAAMGTSTTTTSTAQPPHCRPPGRPVLTLASPGWASAPS
eukprot:scaffold539_cov359-Prasinococcus_capsulatus_cf.AAC.9